MMNFGELSYLVKLVPSGKMRVMTADPPAFRRADWERRSNRGQSRPDQAADQLAAMAMASQPAERLGTKDELRGDLWRIGRHIQ